MARNTLVGCVLGACALVMAVAAPQAHAVVIQFDVENHPRNDDPSGKMGFASFIPQAAPAGWQSFSFDDVIMVVDTGTGVATMSGDISHNISGELWKIDATFSGIHSYGSFSGGNSVPYDDMFSDLLSAGLGGGAIVFGTAGPNMTTTENQLTLSTDLLNPTYTGPRSFIGKGMPNPLLISFRDSESGFGPPIYFDAANFPGAQYDILGASGWFSLADQPGVHAGDIHFALRNPSIIPEPMSMALFGLGSLMGLAGGVGGRRKRAGQPNA